MDNVCLPSERASQERSCDVTGTESVPQLTIRLMSFSRFTWPSRGPLLHGSVNPASTAALSCWIPLANDLNSGNILFSTKLSQVSNCSSVRSRIICMKACVKR